MARGPANLVNLESVSKTYGTRTLLEGVSLGVAAGERIGVVGRNGDGKTTLLDVLSARVPADQGRVSQSGSLRLAHLGQHDRLDPGALVREIVTGGRAEHDWRGSAVVREVMAGLLGGLDAPVLPDGLDTVIGPLSGGERRRVALAQLLVGEPDLLVLDEPTNHLDVEVIDWLARHLAARRCACVVVTHDRWFLDAVATRTWEVDGAQVHEYDGGYSAYVLAKAERSRLAAAVEDRRRNLIRKELAWLRRGPPARTSKPRFRVEAANALIADEPPARNQVELLRFAVNRLGRTVYELHDVTLRRGDRELLRGATWSVGPGERTAIVGVNGSGKTSLLRLLAGEFHPDAGRVVTGQTVRAAYLSQEVAELPGSLRVLEAVESVRRVIEVGRGRELSAGQLCERFGFVGDLQWAPVADLSGGQRRRLQLMRLLMGEPNVLLLDEPTNDLDIETLTSLEDLLDGWPGTLLVVSHDRYFVERVCDQVMSLPGDGQLRHLPGGVDDYLAQRAARAGQGQGQAQGQGLSRVPGARRSAGDTRAAARELGRLERRLERLAADEVALHEELVRHATDHEEVLGLDARLRTIGEERAELEEKWLILAEQAE